MAQPREAALEEVQAYCAGRAPPGLGDELKIKASRRGRSITIVESRPPWNPSFGADWSDVKLAQLRHDPDRDEWSLYCSDSNGRWWPYDGIGPTADVSLLLREIEADPTGIFWG